MKNNYLIISVIILIIIGLYLIKKNRKIPRIIYQTYKTQEDANIFAQCSKNKLMEINKNYKYVFYDDNMVDNYIKTKWGNDMYSLYNTIDNSYGPSKADLFRYLLMYDKGGIYLDIKSSCKLKFDNIIKNDDEFILTHWKKPSWAKLLSNPNGEFVNWFIACKPKHIFLKNTIKNIIIELVKINKNKTNVFGKLGVLKMTGPIMYTKSILNDIKNVKNTKYRIIPNHDDIGLEYLCSKKSHTKIMKDHYSKNKKRIINHTPNFDNKDTTVVINNIFNHFDNNSNNNSNNNNNKIGVVMSCFNRSDYVLRTLNSLKQSDLSNTILCIIDDHSSDKKVWELIQNFKLNNSNCEIIKIKNSKNIGIQKSLKKGWDLLYNKCDYLTNIDSDVLVKPDWLHKLKNVESSASNLLGVPVIITGFNCTTTCLHKIIKEYPLFYIKKSLGGINIFFSKQTYKNIIFKVLSSNNNHGWDWALCSAANNNNYPMIATKPSVIQHIGANGLNSGEILGKKLRKGYDIAEDF
jgi:mannosyltransferase OCH1-like enzyme